MNASALAQTGLAKSVLDASWTAFRTQLQYKGDCAGTLVREVNESFSTQTCSSCQSRTGPKGRTELNVRTWTCSVCGTQHDRDTNAANNILVRGMFELEKEFTIAGETKVDEAAINKDSRESALGHGRLAVGILAL